MAIGEKKLGFLLVTFHKKWIANSPRISILAYCQYCRKPMVRLYSGENSGMHKNLR